MYSAQSLVAAAAFLTEHKFKPLERGVGGGRHDCDDQQNLSCFLLISIKMFKKKKPF